MRRASLPLLIALAPCAWADGEVKCNDAGTMSEMRVCASDARNVADAALNAIYQALLTAGADDPAFLEELRKSQRLWIQFRDAELNARFACEDKDDQNCWGSMFLLLEPSYAARLTRERTAQLKEMLQDRYPNSAVK